ncbi:hypothetical protein LR48_Vigan08g045200 [Vigna angularis]|uniref:Uncharacterized protein n=1 Tax=Phaseolus angularis TaxID=3914 RepID=A0A0L9V3I1_PHAAN|nr:hypothetical protein LR48_Vigan08g045200 [Vigna angularis]
MDEVYVDDRRMKEQVVVLGREKGGCGVYVKRVKKGEELLRPGIKTVVSGSNPIEVVYRAREELLQDIKKGKKFSEEGEYLANDEEKKEERCPQGSKLDEEPLFLWVEGVELSTIEGNDTHGQATRATNVFEVHNIKGSTKVHPTVNNMEENAVQGFKTWQKKSKNISWKNLAITLLRIVEGNRRSTLCESWAVVTQIGSVTILLENLKVDGGNLVNHSNLVGSSFNFLGTGFSNDMWLKKVFRFQPFSSYTVKSSFVGNKGAATAESFVVTRTDEVRDLNLRISQNWAKRIQEEWKSLEEDLSYRPPPKPPDLKL